MAKPAPTPEQSAIISAAMTGQDLVVTAGAGAGKTSTLKMIANALAPKRGLYIAYGKAIKLEAEKSFPGNVECRTAHSLAYKAICDKPYTPYGRRVSPDGKRVRKTFPGNAAYILNIQPIHVTINGDEERTEVSSKKVAILVGQTINNFCHSADTQITPWHVKKATFSWSISDEDRARLVNHVLPYAQAAWKDMNTEHGRLTAPFFTHDCYLKMWSLTNPQLDYDFVLFDEAQDADPAIAHVVGIQRNQKIMVGDSAQAIYGWRGAIDAMKGFHGERLALTKSFRFGQAIADYANRWLDHCETELRITGFEKIDSTVDSVEAPNAVLCRTNAGVIESALALQASGKKVAIVGGTKQIAAFATAAKDLMDENGTTYPELVIFKTWSQVVRAVKEGEADDLRVMVNLIEQHGVDVVLEVCNNSTDPSKADVICSTAHKAKGLEWDSVRIHTDFQAPKENKISLPEAMLIYVAVTRAKRHLDNSALSWLETLERELASVGEGL